MKVQFKEQVEQTEAGERRFKQQSVEVKNGDYRRVFEAKDEPFEVTAEEWPLLRRTGEFEIVKEAVPASQTEQQNEQGDASARRTRQRAGDK